jgi:hypothetical protein
MGLMGNNARAIGELHIMARPAVMRRHSLNHSRQTVTAKHEISGLEIAVPLPAGRRWHHGPDLESFPVLSGNFDVRNPIPPHPVGSKPAEQVAHDLTLPVRQVERLAGLRPFDVPQLRLEESDGSFGVLFAVNVFHH